MPKATTREHRQAGRDRRQTIMDTAASLFLDHSYERATMRSIGSAVGIDPATIYYYFPSKEAIVVEIVEVGAEGLLAALEEAMSLERVQDQLRAAVLAHVRHAITGPYQPLLDQVFLYLPDEARAGIITVRTRIVETWRVLIERAVAEGLIALADPTLVRLHLITAMNGTYRWFHPDGPLTIEQVADSLIALVGADR